MVGCGQSTYSATTTTQRLLSVSGKGGEHMDKEMCRGDTMLISIDAPTEYPVTTLQDVRMSIKQGHNETLIDGQHLTKVGYDIIAPKIEAWMRTL